LAGFAGEELGFLPLRRPGFVEEVDAALEQGHGGAVLQGEEEGERKER
jgi:hypothetical protein